MRVLFVSAEMPFPPHKGQRMRNWAILRALAAEGHEVTLIAFAEAEELMADQSTLRKLCPVVDLVPSPSNNHRGFLRYLARLRSLGSRLPHGPWRFRSPALVACVRRHMERQAFDVVIWDEVYNLENLQEPLPVPVLLNHHDVMQVVWRRYLEVEPNPIKRAYAWTEYCKLLRWEGQACSRVAGVLACSEVDREVLKQICPQVPVAVVPNVVDTSSYVPVSKDDGSTILFVGGMDWYPNQDAVAFFGKNIFPLIRELAPAARFVVAGRGPSPEFRAGFAGIPGIEFTGRVQDIRSVIASAAVCVVPVRIGSGVRWKILEAAAMEKPIVSTRIGAEGLDFADGEEILLADRAEEFTARVVSLLRNESQRAAFGRAARLRVEQQYSFSVLRCALREALQMYTREALQARVETPLGLSAGSVKT